MSETGPKSGGAPPLHHPAGSDSTPGPGGAGVPKFKRSAKNYLLDAGMQVRLSIYVALVVMGVGTGVGYFYVRAQEEANLVAAMDDPKFNADIQEALASEDRKKAILLFAVLTFAAMVGAVAAIKVTHKVAGPAFVIGRHCRAIAKGRYPMVRALRDGDLLQDLGRDFKLAADALRVREQSEIDRLSSLLQQLESPGAAGELRPTLETLLAEKVERLRDAPERTSPTPVERKATGT